MSKLTNKYKLKQTQYNDKELNIWYVYSGGALEYVHYAPEPVDDIEIINNRPDDQPLKSGKAKTKNYLNNADFLAAWQESYDTNTITQEFSDALQLLIYRISLKSWSGYTWIDEWRQQCYLVAITRYKKFNPEKSTACFAYFSSLINNCLIDCLRAEQKQRRVKDHVMIDAGLDPSWQYDDSESD